MCSLVDDPFDTGVAADDERVAKVEKEPGLKHPGDTLELLIERTRVVHCPEFTIDDLVASIGQVG